MTFEQRARLLDLGQPCKFGLHASAVREVFGLRVRYEVTSLCT